MSNMSANASVMKTKAMGFLRALNTVPKSDSAK